MSRKPSLNTAFPLRPLTRNIRLDANVTTVELRRRDLVHECHDSAFAVNMTRCRIAVVDRDIVLVDC